MSSLTVLPFNSPCSGAAILPFPALYDDQQTRRSQLQMPAQASERFCPEEEQQSLTPFFLFLQVLKHTIMSICAQ